MVSGAFAASHRNGALLLEDQTANLNDFHIFRGWQPGHPWVWPPDPRRALR